MDLFAKDHPLEAAALRTQSAKCVLRSFEFEKLPPTVRHKIFRELLLKPQRLDIQIEESYSSEHEELGDRIEGIMVEIGEGDNQMHPEIMCTSKKIHKEAAAVLYGENWFTWSIYGMGYVPMWHTLDRLYTPYTPLSKPPECPRHYSRLITKMRLEVSTRGDEHDPTQADAIFWTTMNLQHACKVLSLNDFKILKVDFWNGLGRRHGGSARTGYYGERCLEPLKRCRAEKVSVDSV